MKLNHRFAPRNAQELEMVRAIELATEILESHLNVQVTLQAQRQPGWAGADAFHAGMYCHDERLVKINFRNLTGQSAKTVLTVLGHEMRHAVQHQHGMFCERGRWIGPRMDDFKLRNSSRFARYYNRPEEVDARTFEDVYANLVINDSRFTKVASALDVPGELMMKRDYDATYKALGYTGARDPEKQSFKLADGRFAHARLSEAFPNKSKWTNSIMQKMFTEKLDMLERNVFEFIMVPVTLDDFVS